MLSKKAQKELSGLINRLQVCSHMLHELPPEQRQVWRDAETETTIYLYEKYGIALPNLKYCQSQQSVDK